MKTLLPIAFVFGLLGTTPVFAQYSDPYGIPTPPLGVTETAPTYSSSNSSHFWVDLFYSGGCSNSNNGGRGAPTAPRCTIPATLSAGTLVMVQSTGFVNTSVNPNCGAGANLCWIVGASPTAAIWSGATGNQFVVHTGQYLIVDGLTFDGIYTPNTDASTAIAIDGADYIAVRHSKVQNFPVPPLHSTNPGQPKWRAGLVSVTSDSGANTTNVVFYDVTVQGAGETSSYETDRHGMFFFGECGTPGCPEGDRKTEYVEKVWVLDCTIYNTSGNGIQLGQTNDFSDQNLTRHIYIGRSVIGDNGETGLGIKSTNHVVVSQNAFGGYAKPSYTISATDGSAIILDNDGNGPLNTSFLFNVIYSSRAGVRVMAPGGTHLFWNNVFIDLNKASGEAEPNVGSNAGVALFVSSEWPRLADIHFYQNTIHDVHGGVYINNAHDVYHANNIVYDIVSHTQGYSFLTNAANIHSVITAYNLYDDPSGNVLVDNYNPGSNNILDQDPLFVSAGTDYRLQSTSPAVDAGADLSSIAALYFNTYGVDIDKDADGNARPLGSAYDVGAYEYDSSLGPMLIASRSRSGTAVPGAANLRRYLIERALTGALLVRLL